MAKDNKAFPERISVPVTKQMLGEVDALAAADNGRPRGAWVRIQLERLLGELRNGKAKK